MSQVNDAPRYASLRDYLRVVREQRWLVIALTVLFAAAAVGYSVRQDTVYEAETALLFKDENVDLSQFGAGQPSQTAEQRAAISAQRMTRPEVAVRAKSKLNSDLEPGVLAGAINARPEARTNLVIVTARWGDARFAARLADAFAAAARDDATDDLRTRLSQTADKTRDALRALGRRPQDEFSRSLLRQRIAALEAVSEFARPVEISRPATVPANPVAPRPVRNGALGLLLGLTIGLLAAFARDALDRRFKGAQELKRELDLPILGYVRQEALGRTTLKTGKREALEASEFEAFRILRANIEFLDVDAPPKIVVVTSALPEEGKSTVAIGLATAVAQSGRRTLLVECDLRRPVLATRLGIDNAPGLTDFLASNAAPAEILRTVAVTPPSGNGAVAAAEPGPLVCITAGSPSPQPAELLGSQRFATFLAQVREVYDVIVLDTSPLLSVGDTLELVPKAEAVVLCVRASQTTRDQALAAKAALDHFPKRPMGLAVTGLRASEDADYGYYSYAYAYGTASGR